MKTNLKIHKIRTHEIAGFIELFKKVFNGVDLYNRAARKDILAFYTESNLLLSLKSRSVIILIVLHEKSIVGFCSGNLDCGTFWLDWIGVDENYRSKNIAQLLLTATEKLVAKKKVHKIWCDTLVVNKKAISFFKKQGFKKIGVAQNHWYGQDFIFWEKMVESK